MFKVIVALVLILGSICLMTGVIIINQIYPDYNSALAVPVFNALGIFLALLGLGISFIDYRKNNNIKLAKRTMVLGIVCVVILVLLFPFSNSGSLSLIR